MGSSLPGLCPAAGPAPSPGTSFRSPFPVSLLTKCLFWCVHILPDSAIWIEWGALNLQKRPFKILHTGGQKRGFFKYQKQWNQTLRPKIKPSVVLAFEFFFLLPWLLTWVSAASEIWKYYSAVMPAFSLLFHCLCVSFCPHSSTGAPGNSTVLLRESRRWPVQSLMSLTSFRFKYLTLRLNLTLPSQFSFFVIF